MTTPIGGWGRVAGLGTTRTDANTRDPAGGNRPSATVAMATTFRATVEWADADQTRPPPPGCLALAAAGPRGPHRAARTRAGQRAWPAAEPLRGAAVPGRVAGRAPADAGAGRLGAALQERPDPAGRPHGGGRAGAPRALPGRPPRRLRGADRPRPRRAAPGRPGPPARHPGALRPPRRRGRGAGGERRARPRRGRRPGLPGHPGRSPPALLSGR